ncbi:MAG TPA: glycoside hydrolase family 2, partial [Chitinophagaceae bacterium]|nr:glycoside hydrolase family 2 [Chitinophagaceae bacterium]
MEPIHPNYGLTISKEEALAEDERLNPLPRAVLRPNTYILLDGEWRFALDKGDRGLEDHWYLGHHFEHTGHWPGSIEEHLEQAKIQTEGKGWRDTIVAWYEREFPLPEMAGNNGSPTSLLQLTFGACGYET